MVLYMTNSALPAVNYGWWDSIIRFFIDHVVMEQNQTQRIWSLVFIPLGILELHHYIRFHLKDNLRSNAPTQKKKGLFRTSFSDNINSRNSLYNILYFHYWLLAPQWDLYDLHLITVVKMLMQHRRNIACSNSIILILNAISLLPFNPQIKTRCCH